MRSYHYKERGQTRDEWIAGEMKKDRIFGDGLWYDFIIISGVSVVFTVFSFLVGVVSGLSNGVTKGILTGFLTWALLFGVFGLICILLMKCTRSDLKRYVYSLSDEEFSKKQKEKVSERVVRPKRTLKRTKTKAIRKKKTVEKQLVKKPVAKKSVKKQETKSPKNNVVSFDKKKKSKKK